MVAAGSDGGSSSDEKNHGATQKVRRVTAAERRYNKQDMDNGQNCNSHVKKLFQGETAATRAAVPDTSDHANTFFCRAPGD